MESKIDLLGASAQYDICRSCGSASNRVKNVLDRWIYPVVRPDGKRISLLKVLQTNVCENDCYYCTNRAGYDMPRATFTPDELARLFDELARRRRVQGLFLSSGIYGRSGQAMERMLATVELVRRRYGFRGYVHLKIMPGTQDAAIEQAVRLADRVSLNLEAPTPARLARITRSKDLPQQLLGPLRRAALMAHESAHNVSLTTQFVVGAADEPDSELLESAQRLYQQLGLARAYYSAFQPLAHTPLEEHPPTPTWREHRLYQADFLLRRYGYGLDELIYGADGNLPRALDPKQMWAAHHPEVFPIELNTASEAQLLRIPGIGPLTARRIVQKRAVGRVRDLKQVVLAGGSASRAAPYVLLDGRRPPYQLPLWESTPDSGTS
jgi:predicted DNA-binding helix-hairpin-helix protein